MEPRDVTQFRKILSSSLLCQNINMRISVSVHLHVLYGCETRFLSKTDAYSVEDSCLHGRRCHNVRFGVSRLLGNGALNRMFEHKGRERGRGENYIMCTFHQIPLESNRIYCGMGWGEHVALRSDKFVYSLSLKILREEMNCNIQT